MDEIPKPKKIQPKMTDMFLKTKVQPNSVSHSSEFENHSDAIPEILIQPDQIPVRVSTANESIPETVPKDLSPVGSTKPTMTAKSLKSVKFPKDSKSRSFQLQWLEKWKWLEYSISENATYCFACRLFNLNTTKEHTYTVTGYRDWVHASSKTGGFTRHESTLVHIQAMASWQEMLYREENQATVTNLLTHHILEKRRYYMKSLIDVIILLITNEVAFRGNWDKEYHKEDGIFRNLFEFKLKDNEYLCQCQEVMPRNATYMSPEIQNELIEIIAKLVQKDIIDEANSTDVDFLTLMADKDKKNEEIVSVVIRYVKDAQVKESLLWLDTTKLFDAENQADLILKLLESCDLATRRLLSQCYDGAFVMSGDEGGIQRTMQRRLGRTIPYVHCFNHKLHLVTIAAVDSNDMIRLFFDTLKMVYNFFRRAKIRSLYEGSAILNLITRRWAGHHRSSNAVFTNYRELIKTLLMVKADTKRFDGDDIATATGIVCAIQKKEFVFLLMFMNKFLNTIAPADKVLKIVDKIEISSTYYFVIDVFLSEIKRLFENNTDILSAISMVDEFDVNLLKPFEDIGLVLPPQEEMVVAKNYIKTRKQIHDEKLSKMDEKEAKLFKNRFNLLKELYTVKDAFPAVYDFIATIETFGSSTATCEKSFSALERLDRKARMSMTNKRLRHLSFLAFEKKRLQNISIEDILKIFNQNPKRRIQLY